MIRFVLPWIFLAMPLPWLLRALLPPARGAAGVALRVPFFGRLAALGWDGVLAVRGNWLVPAHLVWLLLLLATAQPQWVGQPQAIPVTGRDLMLVIDTSGSMRTMDFQVDGKHIDRLSMVKRVGGKFVAGRVGDRVGLILFGGEPYLRAPLTFDLATVVELLDESEIALAGEYTALGDAIGLGIKRLRELNSQSRVIVALTDGASNAGSLGPLQAAAIAAAHGIRVYTIGIGREDVAGPNPFGVWSMGGADDFNREVLEAVAATTGGVYFHALDAAGLAAAWESLDALEPSLSETVYDYTATHLYPWPLGAALMVSLLLAWRSGRAAS